MGRGQGQVIHGGVGNESLEEMAPNQFVLVLRCHPIPRTACLLFDSVPLGRNTVFVTFYMWVFPRLEQTLVIKVADRVAGSARGEKSWGEEKTEEVWNIPHGHLLLLLPALLHLTSSLCCLTRSGEQEI